MLRALDRGAAPAGGLTLCIETIVPEIPEGHSAPPGVPLVVRAPREQERVEHR
jgi:hypothetical protein